MITVSKTLVLDRTNAGFFVQVSYEPGAEKATLLCETEIHTAVVEISATEKMNAFNHPCLFVDDSHLFFKKAESDKSL